MSRPVDLLIVLIVALAAVQSAVVRENDFDEMVREARSSSVITKTVTTTAATPSTAVILTKLVCAILVNPVATTVCRRKKQYWGVPMMNPFALSEIQQFDTYNPTQVLGFQPSVMPEYRNQPSLQSDSAITSPEEINYPCDIQPSIEGTADRAAPVQTMFRFADPSFFAPLSSLVSEIVSGILNPPTTVTSTQTVYTTTVTSSSYTATATYTLSSIACLPAQVNICPAAPVIAAVAPAPLEATAPVIAAAPVVANPVAVAPVVAAPSAVAPVVAASPAATPTVTETTVTATTAVTPAGAETTVAETTAGATTAGATTAGVTTTASATTTAATTSTSASTTVAAASNRIAGR